MRRWEAVRETGVESEGMDMIQLDQGTVQWQDFMNTLVDCWIPYRLKIWIVSWS
jgi:hypothetical protein